MCGLTLGFFGVILCFVGMECTYIGGADKTKDKMLLAGTVLHFAGGKYPTYTCFFVSANDKDVLPSFSLGINNTAVRRCVQYFCLLLIHQQDCPNNLCSQCRARSLTVNFVILINFAIII